ncbi:MAG: efflux RND transporter periplasmic adaptor subunit [Bacteroidota bacterium]
MRKINLYLLPLWALLLCSPACHPAEEQATEEDIISEEVVIPVTLTPAVAVSEAVEIASSGTIIPSSSTKYGFKIGGVVGRVLVDEGDRIRKGEVLAILLVDEIDAQLQQAELGLAKAKRDLARVENLYRDSIATLEDFENVKTQVDLATETVTQVEFNKRYTKIYASTDGYITRKLVNPGEVIGPGTPVLVANNATSNKGYTLQCSLNDRQWAQVKVKDACRIQLDAYPDLAIVGRVSTKSVQADPASGAFRVEIDLPPVKKDLATGMFGKVTITTGQSVNGISVPYAALVQANGRDGFVYITEDGTSVKRVAVRIADISTDGVLIAAGLAAGQQIVSSNSAFLSPEATIKVIQ